MITFSRVTCHISGLDLFNLSVDGRLIKKDVDPWTAKVLKELLEGADVPYEEKDNEDISKVFSTTPTG